GFPAHCLLTRSSSCLIVFPSTARTSRSFRSSSANRKSRPSQLPVVMLETPPSQIEKDGLATPIRPARQIPCLILKTAASSPTRNSQTSPSVAREEKFFVRNVIMAECSEFFNKACDPDSSGTVRLTHSPPFPLKLVLLVGADYGSPPAQDWSCPP
ncbi:hypothetical protein IWX49DRAFT_630385, partial [Phyllosticta citricarpa]